MWFAIDVILSVGVTVLWQLEFMVLWATSLCRKILPRGVDKIVAQITTYYHIYIYKICTYDVTGGERGEETFR